MSKELEEEGFAPGGELHFSGNGLIGWVTSQDIEGHAADDRKVFRGVILAAASVVLVENYIELPVEVILDTPMRPGDFETRAGESRLESAT
jgi:hypothetical protein